MVCLGWCGRHTFALEVPLSNTGAVQLSRNQGVRASNGSCSVQRTLRNAEERSLTQARTPYDNSVSCWILVSVGLLGIRRRRSGVLVVWTLLGTGRERGWALCAPVCVCGAAGWLAGGSGVEDAPGAVVVSAVVVWSGYRIVSGWFVNGLMTVTVSRRWVSWRSSVSR